MHLLIRVIADGTLIPIVLIGLYALVFLVAKKERYSAYCRVLMAGLTALLVAKLMAQLYHPVGERPFEALGLSAGAAYLPNAGFPSDHALFASAITYAVWFETRSKKLAILLAVLTIIMCIGRVLALVHTPLDIAGGIVAATVGAGWYLTRLPIPTKKHK